MYSKEEEWWQGSKLRSGGERDGGPDQDTDGSLRRTGTHSLSIISKIRLLTSVKDKENWL